LIFIRAPPLLFFSSFVRKAFRKRFRKRFPCFSPVTTTEESYLNTPSETVFTKNIMLIIAKVIGFG